MAALVQADMEAGALGLATGLEYEPGIYSETGEVIDLARVAAGFGGRYMSHLRDEDEFFLVVSGHLDIHLRDRVISLDPGEFYVVPKGVEHRPVAEEGAEIVLIEPKGTLHTGNQQTAQTVAIEDQDWI